MVDSKVSGPSTLGINERWFLSTIHAVGTAGVLVLKSLAYLSQKAEAETIQISRETLARHSGRSIRTVSRAVAKLKILSLIEADQPAPRSFDCWTPNVYRLTALGLHVAALLGSPARATDSIPVITKEENRKDSLKTSEPLMAHAEKPAETLKTATQQQTAPSCGSDLEPVVRALEEADSQRFAHLRDWILAKLRAGVPRCHLKEALEALLVNRDRVQSWAGWVQNRLEDMARGEREAEARRRHALDDEARWRQKRKRWEAERARNAYSHGALMALFQVEQRAGNREGITTA